MSDLEILKANILHVIADFQRNPFDFLYEADIQAALFAAASEGFKGGGVEMIGGYHSAEWYPGGSAVRTTPMKCKYPSGERFDIAVIDRTRVESYDPDRWRENGWKNERFWAQPLHSALEIKYLQIGYRPGPRVDGFKAGP